jgi:hypothetical protein
VSRATDAAKDHFETTAQGARDLIAIHKKLNPKAGRRGPELSLNRASVVLTVAAWQTYVEQLTLAILGGMAPPASDPTAGVYQLLAASVKADVKRLNVPDVRKALDLWTAVNFDPTPAWSFTFSWELQGRSTGNPPMKRVALNAQQVRQELESWVTIRHKIAHGDRLPDEARYRAFITGKLKGEPRLTRRDASRCLSFFERVVEVTAGEASRLHP